MALTSIAAYRLQGKTIDDVDIDPNANIESSKLATRTLNLIIPAVAGVKEGASVANTFDGVFGGVLLPNANSGAIYFSFPKPVEYDSGNVVLRVLWSSAGTTGDLKLTSDIRSATIDSAITSGATDTGTKTTDGTGDDLNDLTITIAAADFNANEFIGLKLSRDPADGSDTLSSDVRIHALIFEYTGRG